MLEKWMKVQLLAVALISLGGCSFLEDDFSKTDFDRILLSYKVRSDQATEEKAALIRDSIKSLAVTGKGKNAKVSAEVVGAERHVLIDSILRAAGLPATYENVRIGGKISGSWHNLPLEVALNRISAGDGVKASVFGEGVRFSPFSVGDNISSVEFGFSEKSSAKVEVAAVEPAPASSGSSSNQSPQNLARTAMNESTEFVSDNDWVSREVELDYISNIDGAQVLAAIIPSGGTAPTVPSYIETGSEFSNQLGGSPSYNATATTATTSSYSYNMPPPPESLKSVRFSTVPGKNSILLHGPSEQVARATQILRQSDQPGEHIVIEALVVDVETEALERVGSQISKLQDNRWSDVATSFGDLLGNAISFTNTSGADNSFAFSAIIDLLVAEDRARVISRPYITALSGQPATVNIATQQYVVAETSQNGATVTTTQPISAGVVLKIVPFALSAGTIRMSVDVEQSEFIPSSGDNVSLSVDRNSATATMQVDSGRSVVIGGLMVDSEAKGNSGFPFLRHVPVLNYLFARQSADQSEREVIIFVTPHVWIPAMKVPLVDPTPLSVPKPQRRSFFEAKGSVPMDSESLELGSDTGIESHEKSKNVSD